MNALDQAFIKAFAKDRAPATTRQLPKLPRTVVQPPDEDVHSVALVLHNLDQQGQRLRVDQPTADALSMARLAAHMVFPSVQHVESYQTEDVQGAGATHVIFEDRLVSLEVADDPRTRTFTSEFEAAEELTEQAIEALPDPEANVSACRDAHEDTEVQALAHTAEDEDDGVASVVPPDMSLADEIEVRLQAECQPRVLLAVPALQAPELMTLELMTSTADRLATGCAAVSAAWTAIEIDVPHVDLDWLAAAVADRETAYEPLESDEQAESPELAAEQIAVAASAPREPLAEDIGLPAANQLGSAEPEPALAPDGEQRRLAPFTPAWEVDAFRWPELCLQLDQETDGKLRQSGEELFVATGDGLKILAVTSVSRREGRSTLALALAQNAARAGSHVAVLDADASNPDLARQLGLESPCDWYDTARRGQPLCEAAVMSLEDGVTLFPLTCPNAQLSGVRDQVLVRTLGEMSRFFDLVVVDLPPTSALSAGPGAADLPCCIDMAVVVRNLQTTAQDQTLATVSTLRNLGVRAVGIIENFAPSRDAEERR